MTAIASLLIVLTLSLLVTRIGAMALMLTGVPREAARFQARSAYSGVGYTTSEAEDLVGHPVRRRIVMLLMLLGNLGVGAVIATLMLSIIQTSQSESRGPLLATLLAGLLALWLAATSRFVERHLNRAISWGLRQWGQLELRDYVALLQLQGGYAISELVVEPADWIAEKSLIELRLPQEGILVLGIRREEGVYLGAPTGDTVIYPGDILTLYGLVERIEELDQRRRGKQGDRAHATAIAEHQEDVAEQISADQELDEE